MPLVQRLRTSPPLQRRQVWALSKTCLVRQIQACSCSWQYLGCPDSRVVPAKTKPKRVSFAKRNKNWFQNPFCLYIAIQISVDRKGWVAIGLIHFGTRDWHVIRAAHTKDKRNDARKTQKIFPFIFQSGYLVSNLLRVKTAHPSRICTRLRTNVHKTANWKRPCQNKGH